MPFSVQNINIYWIGGIFFFILVIIFIIFYFPKTNNKLFEEENPENFIEIQMEEET